MRFQSKLPWWSPEIGYHYHPGCRFFWGGAILIYDPKSSTMIRFRISKIRPLWSLGFWPRLSVFFFPTSQTHLGMIFACAIESIGFEFQFHFSATIRWRSLYWIFSAAASVLGGVLLPVFWPFSLFQSSRTKKKQNKTTTPSPGLHISMEVAGIDGH